MPDRPYILLSCGMSIDGYLGSAAPRRLELSNDADFDRVDAVRASCDAILVGASTVRKDNPRLLVRSKARREARTARGLPPSPIKVTMTERMELDPCADFFTTGDTEKLVYCASPRVVDARSRLGQRGDGGRRRPAGQDAQAQRGPRRPRRAAADGRGRRQGAHAVSDRQPRRRAAAGRRSFLRRRLPSPAVRQRRSLPVEPRPARDARRRSARSATWCCCAMRSRPRCRLSVPPKQSVPGLPSRPRAEMPHGRISRSAWSTVTASWPALACARRRRV